MTRMTGLQRHGLPRYTFPDAVSMRCAQAHGWNEGCIPGELGQRSLPKAPRAIPETSS